MKLKKLNILFSIIALILLYPTNLNAQKRRKNKKEKTEKVAQKPDTKSNEKTISDLVKSSIEYEGLFKVYQDSITGSLQMIISEDQINEEFIYFSQIINSVIDVGQFAGGYRGSEIFKIKKHFDKIEFEIQNTNFYFDPSNPISKSKNSNITNSIISSNKIEAHDKEKGLYLIKADGLFLTEVFTQIKPTSPPGTPPTDFTLGNLDKNKTKISRIKNYPENTDIEVEYVFSKPYTLNGGSNSVGGDGRNVSIKVYHSLIKRPDNGYEVRFDDQRVGYWITPVNDQTTTGSIPYRDMIHRWNLIKKDPNAEISEPVEPIVWWMENTTPLEWRETIKEAGEKWNIAFEKAGFKNAIVIKMQPDDADWDAGDIRYNVLRWTSSSNPPFGGYGPHLSDPRTGQILGADIMLEFLHFTNRVMYDKMYDGQSSSLPTNLENALYCSAGHIIHNNIQFGQSILTVNDASDLEMVRMKKEAMTSLILHEIGHTLGLNHNMKSSQLLSPEQLENKEFIKNKSLTGSIMDYPSINITNDKSKQGHFFSTTIGPYDIWAIQFGYTPFKSEQERIDILNRSTEPELTFGNDADDMRYPGFRGIDPRVNVGDLSNDQITYSTNRIELVNKLMNEAKEKFTVNGESYQELRRVYNILSGERISSLQIISRFIGGIYVERAVAGQKGETMPYTPVSLVDQKRAMDALSKHAFSPEAFSTPNNLYNYLAYQRRGFNFFSTTEDPKIHNQVIRFQRSILNHLLHPNTLQRISDSELYGNEYSLDLFMTDLYKAIFNQDIKGNVNSFRQNLQLEYTNYLIQMLIGNNKDSFSNSSKSLALYNLNKIKTIAIPSGDVASRAHKMHLRTIIENAIKELN